ncbi:MULTISPECIES: tRNA 2-selenouridine(34) synthase MnmH [unclassified Ruegeria]|uniref:tRNA 2-selenouridine(34) synthase MnmH n=1 Tax=unclassified Ruegeria TaxID=2625375 RepID=UPI0014908BC9|nr:MULTISPECIES: tRNA 2-selenouridine(34) synthase MnmH [unclassified Ruegeria]NOD47017.1 tRNA 2-selenouridine(34) synthase MnmH [Ruegeria sp. HKCCD5849]NOD51340.1 tRNA 2-selenouridine(34) synthase MnmH [Ruegeria sp. HKCCD5851]NOD68159.1 tRNA 2-selenouridine(34) synthase MnmH [Ruegeria sp. HKCCD7303]
MALKFPDLSQLYAHGFDTVIDVRSPAEYAEDHLPGAINLPVLNNEERARVGTIYVQESPFLARKLGAALVFRNAANHIEQHLSQHEGSWRPLVYCWRGGQRSGSFTWMLQQIGWRADVVEGGYRTYRRLVNAYLYDDPLPHRLIALDGYTGTAKTDLLALLQRRGVQVLDLEALANHRGSLLGERPGGQPAQKAFESALSNALCAMDPARPVVVEAESSKIGSLILPPSLWTALCAAPRVQITAPIEARTAYLVRAYDDILSDSDRLRDRLSPLRFHRGHEVVDGWMCLIDAGEKHALTQALMEQHYDPAYTKSRRSRSVEVLANLDIASLDDGGLSAAASQIESLLDQL